MDRKIEKKKWPPKKIAILAITILGVAFIFKAIIFGDRSSRLNVQTERLIISDVIEKEFQEFIPVTGTVIPIKTIYLDAIEGGRIDTVYLEAGNIVKRGEPILKLANTNLMMDIMYREAELFQQSNNLRNTRLAMEQNRLNLKASLLDLNYQIKQRKLNYDTDKKLLDKNPNLIAGQAFERTKDEYEYYLNLLDITMESNRQDSIFRLVQIEQLESSLTRMEENLNFVKKNLENLVLTAPVSGQLTSLYAEIGESKSRGQRLGQIDILDGFKIRVSIDEYHISRININQSGEFTLGGITYFAEIKKIYPEVSNGRFEVDMMFTGDEPEGIRRGQTVHVRLELGDLEKAILIPRGGFFQKTGGQWIYVVDNTGEIASKREIRLGRQNPDVFEVLEGLSPGEQVITSSYDSYGDIDKLILNN
ncbi:MAG: efflux RND transporter periplasmic adaptor subunit [Candidatus Marinimicrobia bacterium]|jgi:HlyD family secretion protein|nr:efflux RND transporter periplasmic adaptor subunit [Candidatus Neomarinimicrobiota bacterium]MBT3632861.1 efflux RND transporter periplasmic adaptor subunit [Candidatus Neomarinimicrobiota bacterium]MBT3681971.1 efflux RND transporter periplasmic adaptor subunit [Candidatus Neomarinimicrobiota bacterium]MBT3759000.1 efflux RND transporter periplasmic adaptor subunit [Candidatus Neomarinimicrobiota bacterium]MBT3895101.1 efflux RND transporter periplasmic adaptor subunit [Candidatus Neomarini